MLSRSVKVKGIDLDNVVNKQNSQDAYSAFREIITEKCNIYFPNRKSENDTAVKKTWLTSALIQSITVKKINHTYRKIKVMILRKDCFLQNL